MKSFKVFMVVTALSWIHEIMPPLRLDQIVDLNWKILFIAALISVAGSGGYFFYNGIFDFIR